ncbi:MAG: homoserine dehydrogenase [Clostridia bacterium]|nr:homoserine dehydrogenase [Clostridia bacterium]
MKKVRIGMLGIGNVAKGTYRTLELNREKIQASTGVSIEIAKILNRDISKDRGIDIPKEKYVTDAYDIINDPEIDIIVELIGGIEPATEYMAAALKNGKHVVTANKAALAVNGRMLQELAQEKHVMLRFEASVAGGIPIINAITTALMSNEIDDILGIVNGTTNYILTKMSESDADYNSVLKDAQEKGFAERDPSGDVEGHDVANKLSILMSLIFGVGILPKDIPTHGITSINKVDISIATELGYKIKLLATAKKIGKDVECNVQPCLVPASHPLSSVNNEFNAVFLRGNAVDDLMFYGKGAGPLPTGSAVMGDIIEIAKAIDKDSAFDRQPLLRFDADLRFIGEGRNQYYIRLRAEDRPGVLGNISSTFGKYSVGIETMMQRPAPKGDNTTVPLVFIVYETEREVLDKALAEIIENKHAVSVDNVIRVED